LDSWLGRPPDRDIVTRVSKTRRPASGLLLLLPAVQATDPPGIGNQMTEMFHTILNYTEPTAHLGERRGVLTMLYSHPGLWAGGL